MNIKELKQRQAKLYYLKSSDLNNEIDQKALKKVCNLFLNKLESLKNGFNNCFFQSYKKLEIKSKLAFVNVLKDIKTKSDLIKLLTLNSNEKIKIGLNYEPYIFCENMHKKACNLCDKCYSSKNELSHKILNENEIRIFSLENSFKNFILVYYVYFSNDFQLLKLAFTQKKIFVNSNLKESKNILKDLSIFRYDIKSDIKDQKILNIFNYINIILNRFYNVKYIYTYTKTKNLNFSKCNKNFIVNRSLGLINDISELLKFKDFHNTYITITKKFYLKFKEIINKYFFVCTCKGCETCLNPCYKENKFCTVCVLH